MTDEERIERLEGWCVDLEESHRHHQRLTNELLCALGVLGDTLGRSATRLENKLAGPSVDAPLGTPETTEDGLRRENEDLRTAIRMLEASAGAALS